MAVATDLAGTDLSDPGPTGQGPNGSSAAAPDTAHRQNPVARMISYLPRGNLLDDEIWAKRHNILQWLLLLHLPALGLFGFWMQRQPMMILVAVAPIAVFRVLGGLVRGRRLASFFTTAGIVYCSAALVMLANGAIEAHFHFFIIVGFIALYQDWVPFGWNIVFTVLSHGLGSALHPDLMFAHTAAVENPWRWSIIHGVSVLATCVGVVLFWRTNEDEQQKAMALTQNLNEAELARRRFASDLLVNLARRNQSLLYRQLDIINQLEHQEQDPDALAGLFRLDHLATRIRRNAENLLVLSGEEPPRVWGKAVPLSDVVRASIAETEDLSRVSFVVDERLAVLGHAVIDITHLLAELIENAVRSSPPESQVTVRTSPDVRTPGTVMLTIEDWGVGMPPAQLAEANDVLATPRDVDALVSNRLGLNVISRLANRYSIQVVLTATGGSGITAVVLLPPALFTTVERPRPIAAAPQLGGLPPAIPGPEPEPELEPQPVPVYSEPVSTGPIPTAGRGGRTAIGTPLAVTGRPESAPTPPAGIGWSARAQANQAQPHGQTQPHGTAQPHGQTQQFGSAPQHQAQGNHGRTTQDPNWDGWWEAEEAAAAARSAAGPESAPQEIVHGVSMNGQVGPAVPPAQTGPTTGGTLRLNRRTPQTHLAPELQRNRSTAAAGRPNTGSTGAVAPAPPADAVRAREALSRYQASRQAALAENESAERNRQ